MTEIGEGAAASKLDKGKDWEFETVLVGLKFLSTIKVALDGNEVKGPHWTYKDRNKIKQKWKTKARKLGLPREAFYSKKPAVYAINQSDPEVEVETEVKKSENVGKKAKLVGNLGPLELTGSCDTDVKKHKVSLKIGNKPTGIERFAGKLSLGLELDPPGISIPLEPAMVEVFFILDKPRIMFTTDGVPAEALRLLVLKVGLASKSDPKTITAEISKYFHSNHKKIRYDVEKGKSRYGPGSYPTLPITYQLIAYIFSENKLVNCYDQAGAVQSLCGALGIDIDYYFMLPFGFINKTTLVGYKRQTNNPFYKATKSGIYLKNIDYPKRTMFANHAFCAYTGKIHDACAGPKTGNLGLEDYIKDVIDTKTKLYSSYPQPHDQPGKKSDAQKYSGVTETE